ncbi:MAG TPA: hypothetical protein VIV65_00515, partial [Gemmatimonadaceae bacterium]
QYSAAQAIADSIVSAGGLRNPPFHVALDRSRPYVIAIYLRSKQWAKLATLVPVIGSTAPEPKCMALRTELTNRLLPVAAPELRAIADTVRVHRDDVSRVPELAPCVDALSQLGR